MREPIRIRDLRRDERDTYYPPVYAAIRRAYAEDEEVQGKLFRSFCICMALLFLMGIVGAIAIATSPIVP